MDLVIALVMLYGVYLLFWIVYFALAYFLALALREPVIFTNMLGFAAVLFNLQKLAFGGLVLWATIEDFLQGEIFSGLFMVFIGITILTFLYNLLQFPVLIVSGGFANLAGNIRQTELSRRDEKLLTVLRWLLVLPSAIIGGLIASLATIIVTAFIPYPEVSQIVNSATTPVGFVILGAALAPAHKVRAAIALVLLSTLFAGFTMAVMFLGVSSYSPVVKMLAVILWLISSVFALYIVHKQERTKLEQL